MTVCAAAILRIRSAIVTSQLDCFPRRTNVWLFGSVCVFEKPCVALFSEKKGLIGADTVALVIGGGGVMLKFAGYTVKGHLSSKSIASPEP